MRDGYAECLTKLTKAYPTAKIFYGVSGHTLEPMCVPYIGFAVSSRSGSVPTQGWPCYGPFDTPDRAAYEVGPDSSRSDRRVAFRLASYWLKCRGDSPRALVLSALRSVVFRSSS